MLFPLYIDDLRCYAICNNGIYADDTNFYCKCDQTSDMWYLLELASEYDLVDWSIKWLVDYNTRKTQLVMYDLLNDCGAIDVKLNESNLEGRSSCKMLRLFLSFKVFKTKLERIYFYYALFISYFAFKFFKLSKNCNFTIKAYTMHFYVTTLFVVHYKK